MNTNAAIIESEALHLLVEQKAKLAHKLLESLDMLSESDIEQLWIAEADNRLKEINSGAVATVSAQTFLSEAEALFS